METQRTNCDKEQIQYIQTIQPFGTMLAVSPSRQVIGAAAQPGFGLTTHELLGSRIEDLLEKDYERILESITGRSEISAVQMIKPRRLGKWLSCIAHTAGEVIILELEPVSNEKIDLPSVKFMTKREETLEQYLSYLAENIRTITSYDRVMIYRFWQDWHGEVVAEAKDQAIHSFYQHHFPASDIPEPARRLFTLNWARIIPDVEATPIPLKLDSALGQPLDLTKSILRSPAPIHLEYLRNMDVKASFTLSLNCNGQLWGLIACHNFSKKYLDAEQRGVCALIAKVASSRITSIEVNKTIASHERLTQIAKDLSVALEVTSLSECIKDNKRRLLEYVTSDGFTFIGEDEIVTEGIAPTLKQIRLIQAQLDSTEKRIVETSSLSNTFPVLGDFASVAAGLAAIKIGNNWAIWTKCEMLKTLFWAGDPNKPVYASNGNLELSPRKSFESWRETVGGTAIPWEPSELQALDSLQHMLSHAMNNKQFRVPTLLIGNYADRLEKDIDLEVSLLKERHAIPAELDKDLL